MDDDRFVVMGGIGFDAAMLRDADPKLKEHMGAVAYVLSGFKNLRRRATRFRLRLDDRPPVERTGQGVLIGNLGRLQGGLPVMPDARPDDGLLDVAVLQTRTLLDWLALAARVVARRRRKDPQLELFQARRVEINCDTPQPVERDGDPAEPRDHLVDRGRPQGAHPLRATSERKHRMSTATSVPETYELEGDDALRTLRNTGWAQLAKDSFVRFRAADGTSHSRGLAFQVMLTLLPFVIAVVGLATVLNIDQFRQLLTQTVDRLAPGPAGQIFTQAISQGAKSAARGGLWALLLGAVAALASATVAMGQIERGANRLYGVEQDRPTAEKYWNGFKLACTAGVLSVAAFMLIVGGADMAQAVGLSAWSRSSGRCCGGRSASAS